MRHLLLITVFGLTLPLAIVLVSQSVQAEDAPVADQTDIDQLVKRLGADDFRIREDASKQLEALGAKAKPALEKALKSETSPEVRWRAEQILRRIKGADQEKPLGGPGAPAEPKANPGTPGPAEPKKADEPFSRGNPFGGRIRGKDMDEAMKRVEEMLKKWRGEGRGMGSLFSTRRLTAPGLVLERSITGRVTLRVARTKEDGGATVEDIYSGHSLEDILGNNPKLADHAGMAELKRREAEADWPGKPEFMNPWGAFRGPGGIKVEPFSGGGFGMTMGSGVEIRQGADGATVKIREKDENGKEVVKEYKGATIDEIKKKHPEIADKLGGFSVRVMPPQVFWPGAQRRPLNPFQPNPTTPRAQPIGKAIFGLTLTDVSEALASHLELEKGRGALVANVMPGSQAEAMGVQRNDILLEVNGQPVGVPEAADLLRKAGTDKAAVTLVLLRKGQRQTLTR